jgi:hypothetical protein
LIYLIGSLRNPKIPALANRLRDQGLEVFDNWYAAGPEADDHWQTYEKQRGHSFKEALDSPEAWNVFAFDKQHLDAATAVVMVMPAGKSAHLELGYCVDKKPTYILMDGEPERFDVMYRFATKVCTTEGELINHLIGLQ